MRHLARLIGCTEGQAYTLSIGVVLALALGVVGLPPALRYDPLPTAADVVAPADRSTRGPEAPIGEEPPPITLAPTAAPALAHSELIPSSDAFGPEDKPRPEAPPPTTTTSPPSPKGQLSVTKAAYARAAGGTPAATAGIPRGGLPVGARVGQEDARSYLRVAGEGTTLTLGVVSDPTVTFLADQAAIVACAVVEQAWELEDGAPFSKAPRFDPRACEPGRPSADGNAWTFNLAPLGVAATRSGIALVAVLTAGESFQVTLRSTSSEPAA